MDWIELLIPIYGVLAYYLGIYIGKRQERENWNKLIEDGTLPRPNKH
jgi:hypothetical protein